MTDTIHIFLGTKAQYIKTAPVIRELDHRGTAYRLIDSGQHAEFSGQLRRELGVREPDVRLGSNRDVASVAHALRWGLSLAIWLIRRRNLKRDVFGSQGGVCLVHGDTPSTLLAALMARRAGLRVAHLEAGLRSYRVLHPFPEEMIRIAVMRLSDFLFAPDDLALQNLQRMKVRGQVISTRANTTADALTDAIEKTVASGFGPVVATCHRVENLKSRKRLQAFATLLRDVAKSRPITLVLHPPTEAALRSNRLLGELEAAGVQTRPLMQHADFVNLLRSAPFVITDGGSIQEECAILGVPTLLWRAATERPDGLGRNVLLSRYDRTLIDGFLGDPEGLRRPTAHTGDKPSLLIAEKLAGMIR